MFKPAPVIMRRHGKSEVGEAFFFPDLISITLILQSASSKTVAQEEVVAGLPPLVLIIFTDFLPRNIQAVNK